MKFKFVTAWLFNIYLNSPLLLEMRSGAQYLSELCSTTMCTVLVVFPRLVRTRHSQFPVKPGWMFEMVKALIGKMGTEIRCSLDLQKLGKHGGESYLAMREQFCTTRFSMKMPWVASGSTMRPFWYQRTCMSSATREAWHWNGRLSPSKTTWRWDGVSWKEGSSSGASGKKQGAG